MKEQVLGMTEVKSRRYLLIGKLLRGRKGPEWVAKDPTL